MRLPLLLPVLLALSILSLAQEAPVRVMTFNIRYANPGDGLDRWELRRHLVAGVIQDRVPAIVGLQEALSPQLDWLAAQLPEYDVISKGRDLFDRGERCALFVRRDRFAIVSHGTFWLSETPEKASRSWDAALNRIVTFVEVEERSSKQHLFVFNTHFDHRGQVAREKSAALILEKMKEIAKDVPATLIGDFNSAPHSRPYDVIEAELHDARHVCESSPFGPSGTFTGFDKAGQTGSEIDYLFVRDGVRVLRHVVISQVGSGARVPSDHRPVFADLLPWSKVSPTQLHLTAGWRFALLPKDTEKSPATMDFAGAARWPLINAGTPIKALGFEGAGVGWYRKEVRLPAALGPLFLELRGEGMMTGFAVFINGREVLDRRAAARPDQPFVLPIPKEQSAHGRLLITFEIDPGAAGEGGLTGLPLALVARPQ